MANEDWRQQVEKTLTLRQGYLANTPARNVRVRIADREAFLTIKAQADGISRLEFEYPIPIEDAQALLALCTGVIEKYRHHVMHAGHLWEIDEFLGQNAGLIVAEIELSAKSEVFEHPVWLGQEVTQDTRYLNSQLSQHPFSTWSVT